MHEDEIVIDDKLAKELIMQSFPSWSSLPLVELRHSGTDNVLFRLGEDMLVRLSKRRESAKFVERENSILSFFRDKPLKIEIPRILGIGKPSQNYPQEWTVQSWIDNDPFGYDPLSLAKTAKDLGIFVKEIRKIPVNGFSGTYRGQSLHLRKKSFSKSLSQFNQDYDVKQIQSIWEYCLSAKEWNKDPRWYHGDLHPGNFLFKGGSLKAVIDFGMAGTGDPSCDLLPAWSFLDRNTRQIFRDTVGASNDEWLRSRAWALYMAIMIIPYYQNTNEGLVKLANRMIHETLNEV